MTGLLSLTLRKSPAWIRSKALKWHLIFYLIALTVMAVSGPFGTFTELSFAGRLLYWAIAMGVPRIVLATSTELILTRQKRSLRHVIAIVLGVNILAAIATSMTVVALEYLILPHRFDQLSFAALYVYTFIIGLTVSALVTPFRLRDRYGAETARLAGGRDQETKQPAADDLLFLKVPLRLGRDLVHLKMQDHYVEVVTTAGQCMVLMRFADALTCLPAALGNQVHRSHWVAWGHANKSFIRAGRQFLLLDNGVEVPVSRRFKKVVRERFG